MSDSARLRAGSERWADPPRLRLIAITVAITCLYLLLEQLWLVAMPSLTAILERRAEAEWPAEAVEVAQASREAESRVPDDWRSEAYRLGVDVGYTSHVLGNFAFSPAEGQSQARAIVAPRIAAAQGRARAMGLGEVTLLSVTTVDDFGREDERIERDELGLAARLEERASPRHRHLFLTGMHVGVAAAVVDISGGEVHNPKRRFIGRHATLAGVPTAAWEPAATEPDGRTPAARLEAYQRAVADLDRVVAQLGRLP